MARFVEVTTTANAQLYLNPRYIKELKRMAHTDNRATRVLFHDDECIYVKESPYEIASQLSGKYRPKPRPL